VGDSLGGVSQWEMLTGKEIGRFRGHTAALRGVAFAADGRTAVSGSADTTVLLWDIMAAFAEEMARPARFGPTGLNAGLDRLGRANAVEAYQALWSLVAAAEQAVPLLRGRLAPAPDTKQLAARLAALIANLDDKRFAVREKAFGELLGVGDLAEQALRQALA